MRPAFACRAIIKCGTGDLRKPAPKWPRAKRPAEATSLLKHSPGRGSFSSDSFESFNKTNDVFDKGDDGVTDGLSYFVHGLSAAADEIQLSVSQFSQVTQIRPFACICTLSRKSGAFDRASG